MEIKKMSSKNKLLSDKKSLLNNIKITKRMWWTNLVSLETNLLGRVNHNLLVNLKDENKSIIRN